MSVLDYLTGACAATTLPLRSPRRSDYPTDFALGRAAFEGEPQRFVYNPLGTVHGGWAATLIDSATGCAVHSTLPAGKGYTTVDLQVSMVRAITDRVKRIRCEATIVYAGGSIAPPRAASPTRPARSTHTARRPASY